MKYTSHCADVVGCGSDPVTAMRHERSFTGCRKHDIQSDRKSYFQLTAHDGSRPVADIDSWPMTEPLKHMKQASGITFPSALVSIEVLGDRGLRLVVEELPGLGAPSDDRYELVWEVVVGFLVRGDPFPSSGPSRVTLSDLGTATAFLDMVRSNSNAEPDYIAAMHGVPPVATELGHWQVATTDALIDVAAAYGPTMRPLP